MTEGEMLLGKLIDAAADADVLVEEQPSPAVTTSVGVSQLVRTSAWCDGKQFLITVTPG